ncbi:hypothetical protein B0A50_00450 [Salinomyces thailandicus]|uniref:Uncharacterized protein n=1 Tax=Salinomyces thailandicus TaxID=706561 RepID=A0A4U0UDX3_9PEZI|nr:hypothetical protein B0A50_00450 [Salinomyces thailandica]
MHGAENFYSLQHHASGSGSGSTFNPTEDTKLLQTQPKMPSTTPSSARDRNLSALPRVATTHIRASSASRPPMVRAATTTIAPTLPTASATTPLLSRPLLPRSATTTANIPVHSLNPTIKSTRPSLLRRATDILELNAKTSYTARNAPTKPSHWTDHAHRDELVKIWDAIHAAAAESKYPKSTTAKLVSTEKVMLLEYSELAEGDVPLSREWMEYVLGICLRHPFCTAEKMGVYEVLSASGGSRANWGPW